MIHPSLSALKENLILLGINLKVKVFNLVEYGRVVTRYYSHFHFAKIDLALLTSYLFSNPFVISKQFLAKKGESEIYTYGETPLTTLELIARNCEINRQDVVFELGCGRGRTCLWLNQIIGCSVVGFDFVPTFIEKGEKIKQRFCISGLSFRLEDFFQSDLKGASVIYLYGTCYSANEIRLLIDHLSKHPKGTTIITVSYALTDFQPEAPFRIVKQFSAPFTWGKGEVYFQKKI